MDSVLRQGTINNVALSSIVCLSAIRPYAVTSTSTLKQDGVSIEFYDRIYLPYSGKTSGVVANPTNSYCSTRVPKGRSSQMLMRELQKWDRRESEVLNIDTILPAACYRRQP
jgi:hypothetical protein